MKKFKVIFLSCLFVFALAGCGGGTEATGTDATGTDGDPAAGAPVEAADGPAEAGSIDSYAISIDSAALGSDYEGTDVLIVTYSFTNNSNEATSFDTVTMCTAYQDGVEVEQAYSLNSSSEGDLWKNAEKSIQSGITLQVQKAFKLGNTASPVDVEVKGFITFDDTTLVKTFDIAS